MKDFKPCNLKVLLRNRDSEMAIVVTNPDYQGVKYAFGIEKGTGVYLADADLLEHLNQFYETHTQLLTFFENHSKIAKEKSELLTTAHAERNRLASEKFELVNLCEKLKGQNEILVAGARGREDKINNQELTISGLNTELVYKNKEIRTLKRSNEEISKDKLALLERVQSLKKSNDTNAEMLKAAGQANDQLHKQIKELKAELSDYDSLIKRALEISKTTTISPAQALNMLLVSRNGVPDLQEYKYSKGSFDLMSTGNLAGALFGDEIDRFPEDGLTAEELFKVGHDFKADSLAESGRRVDWVKCEDPRFALSENWKEELEKGSDILANAIKSMLLNGRLGKLGMPINPTFVVYNAKDQHKDVILANLKPGMVIHCQRKLYEKCEVLHVVLWVAKSSKGLRIKTFNTETKNVGYIDMAEGFYFHPSEQQQQKYHDNNLKINKGEWYWNGKRAVKALKPILNICDNYYQVGRDSFYKMGDGVIKIQVGSMVKTALGEPYQEIKNMGGNDGLFVKVPAPAKVEFVLYPSIIDYIPISNEDPVVKNTTSQLAMDWLKPGMIIRRNTKSAGQEGSINVVTKVFEKDGVLRITAFDPKTKLRSGVKPWDFSFAEIEQKIYNKPVLDLEIGHPIWNGKHVRCVKGEYVFIAGHYFHKKDDCIIPRKTKILKMEVGGVISCDEGDFVIRGIDTEKNIFHGLAMNPGLEDKFGIVEFVKVTNYQPPIRKLDLS